MRTLITYSTKHGSVEKCAEILSQNLIGEVDLQNLKNGTDIDLSKYNKIIIGGSIYMGKIRKEVKDFCMRNLNELKEKSVGLFICCMGEENGDEQLKNSFPQNLLDKVVTKQNFGGEFRFKKMNFFERFIVKMVSKNSDNSSTIDTRNDVSMILEDNIYSFAQSMNNVHYSEE